MAIVDTTTLKTYFETRDKPTQSQFEDLIDTAANKGASCVFNTHGSGSQVTSGTSVLTVKFNTEYLDVSSDYNTTTGIFTAPRAGKYFATVNIAGTGSVLNDYFRVGITDDNSDNSITFAITSTSLALSAPAVSAVFDVAQGAGIYAYINRLSGTGTFTLSTVLVQSSLTIFYLGE